MRLIGEKPNPTDLEVLNAIYDRYYDEFEKYVEEEDARETKVYVPIDIEDIAEKLNVEKDIIFGRLYYHLDHRYGYRRDDGTRVPLFSLKTGGDRHCVNFPYMASVLADLRDKKEKHLIATSISILSLLVAGGSLAISLLG